MNKDNLSMVCILCLAFTVSACEHFTPAIEKPIISDNCRGLTTFAIIPSRRMVIVKPYITGNEKVNFDPEKDHKGRDIFLSKFVCSEPVPDVSDNLASSISAAITGKGQVADKGSAEIATNLAKVLGTTSVSLFKRTQGLQLYRDGMYNLCLAAMNGQIKTPEEYNDAARMLLEKAFFLIDKEIPSIQATVTEISAQNAASSATEAKKAALDTEVLSKSSKQSAEAAEAAAKNSKQSAEAAEAAAKKTAEKK
jgi:hypothetical protein